MKNTLDTEEIIISSLLLLCGAIATVTRYILIPAACLILALLGWRPPATAAPASSRMELEEAELFPALLPPANRDNRVELLMDQLQTIAPCDWKAREAIIQRVQEARTQQEARIQLARETRDPVAEDGIIDRWNDYSSEVPTAEERSPSLRRGNR